MTGIVGLGLGEGARLIVGRVARNAKSDVVAAGGWLSRRKPIELLAMALAIAVVVQHVADGRHAAKIEAQLGKCATALTNTRAAFDQTVANYGKAADDARAADKANVERVTAQQKAINEGTVHDLQARIADARSRADRLRHDLEKAAFNPGGRGAASVSGIDPARPAAAQAPDEDGFSIADRLTATEQAIQLDELITAIEKITRIDPNGAPDGKAAAVKP